MDNLIKLSKEFENFLKAINRTGRTTSEIMRKLNRFFSYLKNHKITHVDQITKDIVMAYQVEVYQSLTFKGTPYSIAHQNSMISAVKQFLAFLKDNDYIMVNSARHVRYASGSQSLPGSILTKSEARKIMQAPDTRTVLGYRDRTILEVLYSSGIRKTELRNLTINDVDYHDGLIRVQGKGRKERIVPIGRIACRYLENYIKSVRTELIRDPYNDTLFLSLRGRRFNHSTVWKLVKKYAKKAKIRKNVHCHTFRHSCATAMLKNKADIRSIQEMLGHASLKSTQIYTRINITDLKEVHSKCHPRERDKE